MVAARAGQSADQTVNAEKAMCYCVTAHRPSAVLDSVVCNLTGPKDVNLIISKCTRLEIHQVKEGGTVGLADVPIYGRIEALKVRLHPISCQIATSIVLYSVYRFLYLMPLADVGLLHICCKCL